MWGPKSWLRGPHGVVAFPTELAEQYFVPRRAMSITGLGGGGRHAGMPYLWQRRFLISTCSIHVVGDIDGPTTGQERIYTLPKVIINIIHSTSISPLFLAPDVRKSVRV